MRSRLKIREFHVLLFPPLFWLIVFFAVPLLIVLIYSVSYRGTYGGVIPGFTLEHYRHLFDPLYVRVFGRSVLIATINTVLTLTLSYPMIVLSFLEVVLQKQV